MPDNITSIDPLRNKVPDHTLGALDRYVNQGLPPGSFLTAVLENKLFQAFQCADYINQAHMFDIVNYIYNRCPMNCHGSPEIVEDYITNARARHANERDSQIREAISKYHRGESTIVEEL